MHDRHSSSQSPPARGAGDHASVVRVFSELDYRFETGSGGDGDGRIVGFAPESVVEVIEGSPATVSLLFSASTDRTTVVRATMAIVALASVTGLDFTDWLAVQMSSRGLAAPWKASRRFNRRRVRAEHLVADAMLVTIETVV